MSKFQSIRSQLLGLVAAATLPFLVLLGVGLWNQSRIQEAQALQRALAEARVIAAQVDDHFGNLENLMIGLRHAVSTDPRDVEANDTLLRRLKSELPDYIAEVMVIALNGDNIGNSSGHRFSAQDRDYFAQILAGESLAVGRPTINKTSDIWLFPVASPIKDAGGELRGVLLVGTLLEKFRKALRVTELPRGSTVRILSDKGIGVASFPDVPNWIARDRSGVSLVAHQLRDKEGAEIATWGDGATRITGFSTAHRAPWLVTVGLPIELASAAIAQKLQIGAAFCAIAVAIGSLIAWMLSGRIIRPLRRLERDAAILAGGNLGHRTPIESADEVGKLSHAFNQMASSLEARQNELLERANEVREAKDMLDAVIDASPVAIVYSDLDRKIMLWNRAAEHIYGYLEAEVIGRTVRMVPPDGKEASKAIFYRALQGEVIRDVEVQRLRKDGQRVDICLSAAPLFGQDGAVRGVAFVHEDMTARKQAEEQLRQFAHFDQLTGLANRRSMEERLAGLLRGDAASTIALLDLDGFKDVNDTLGHSTGDRLLIEVARRLETVARSRTPEALVFRLGGDEFVAILPGCGDPLVVCDIIGEMLVRLADPFDVAEHVLHIGASAGLAVAPLHGASVDELLSNADLALYQAKKEGGRVYRFFAPTLRAQAQSRRGLDAELRRAFARGEFEIYYQPQVRISDGAVTGAEALLRWKHQERGLLAPALFVDALADNPIAPEVGRWILRTACAQAAKWRAKGLCPERIEVNLFPTQLRHPSLIDDVGRALRDADLAPELLELEITENIAPITRTPPSLCAFLREQGVKIAFDEFGTGYASLSCLTMFPVSRIKIDRGFVGRIANGAQDAAIIRSLITMAKSLDLEVIAEGVEDGRAAAFPAQRAVRGGAGLPLRQATVGGGVRRLSERRPHCGSRRPG